MPPRLAVATGLWTPTADLGLRRGCQVPRCTARLRPSPAHRRCPVITTGTATASWDRTEECSSTATPRFMATPMSTSSTDRSSTWPRSKAATASSASARGVGRVAGRALELGEVGVPPQGDRRVPEGQSLLALGHPGNDGPEEAGPVGGPEADHRRADEAPAALEGRGRLGVDDGVEVGGVGR